MCYKMMLQLGVVLCMIIDKVEVQQVTTPFDPLSTTLHHYPAGWPQRRFREVTNTCEKLDCRDLGQNGWTRKASPKGDYSYCYFHRKKTWLYARCSCRMSAKTKKGDLASIDSSGLNTLIKNLASNVKMRGSPTGWHKMYHRAWIGGWRNNHGNWKWSDGEEWGKYKNWYKQTKEDNDWKGSANNMRGENYLEINFWSNQHIDKKSNLDAKSGFWNDIYNSEPRGFVCQMKNN